uniref:Uncharacterized protein n=1 Tax=Takifugu rubripes TaxID=31033 RepID=A0A674PIJ2_TAKRU
MALFGIEAPAPVELTGWRKHLNSYTLQGRRNVRYTLSGNLFPDASEPLKLYHQARPSPLSGSTPENI